MKFNFKKVRNGESGLQFYPGYLPTHIRVCFGRENRRIWRSTLIKNGTYNEVIAKMGEIRQLRKKGKLPKGWERQELLDWLEDNPEYKPFIEITY